MKALIVLALALAPLTARAGCPTMTGADAALAMQGDDLRLAWIEGRLARTSRRAKFWLHGWELGLVSATAINLAMLPILGDTTSNRIDFGLGAATTIIGVVPLIFWQPRVIDDHEAVEAARGTADVCSRLADAERRLTASATTQATLRAWYMHGGNVVLNFGVTLLFGAFHHWRTGILSGVGGAVIGEAIIFSEPVDQIDDLAKYRRGVALSSGLVSTF
ncbi:MAG: hypothetical protein ABI704_05830 [Kofleriaceae bacterium]